MISDAPFVIRWKASSMNTPLDSEIIPARVRLGPLEQRILAEVWSHKSLTVRELLADGKVRLAYTTVMTTLDRLFKKGLLDRAEEGRAFRYYASCRPDEVARWVAVAGVRRWIESVRPSSLPLSYFVEAIGPHDALLDELRVLVERKRTELKKQKGKQP
jgi:predicted transcriptional regulator